MAIDDGYVDVSHGLGIPFGGIGTGYGIYGKYGFCRLNFDSTPDREQMECPGYGPRKVWDYEAPPDKVSPMALAVTEGLKSLLLQETPIYWWHRPAAEPVQKVRAHARLPKGVFAFENAWNLRITMTGFSPMVPHDLRNSTVPVAVFDLELENLSSRTRTLRVELAHREPMKRVGTKALYEDAHGQVVFGCEGGQSDTHGVGLNLNLRPGDVGRVRFLMAWYYPKFKTPSTTAIDVYRRYYTRYFSGALEVLDYSLERGHSWSEAINRWHESIRVPGYFSRLWFSSLASTICSTMLSADPYFFEIETPHRHVDTMDVTVYSSWLYLINWPELERMEMDQYLRSIPSDGDRAGLVWHSLWNDAAHYVEEPIFLTRVWRDFLWFNDREWLMKAFGPTVRAANRVFRTGHHQTLIKSTHGNQSYDVWKMPGVSAFVNSAWVYGLHGLAKSAEVVGLPALVDGEPVETMAIQAAEAFDRILWNKTAGYWNCFFRTEDAEKLSTPESAFTDQLFGKWAVAVDPTAGKVLPAEKTKRALEALYQHNVVDDPDRGFRGWVNGMLPGRKPDIHHDGYHAWVCWIGAQLDLGSLLGEAGNEEASLDVFRSVEQSLHNNHLAVGEWNGAIDEHLKVRRLPEEPGKDTPRFPPYPRYKCAWEYLVRILGLKMDEQFLYLSPFRTIDFTLNEVTLAGTSLSVTVQSGWTTAVVDGEPVTGPVRLSRSKDRYKVEFRG